MATETKEGNFSSDIFGTKELLKIVFNKLTDQLLIYGLAFILIVVSSYLAMGRGHMDIILIIVFIFLVCVFGYIYLQTKNKVAQQDPKTMNQLLTNRLGEIEKSTGAFELKVWAEKNNTSGSRDISVVPNNNRAIFFTGDKITIHFKCGRDGYLTLVNIGTSGKLTILFPNSIHPDNAVKANAEYLIPGSNYGFDYVLSGPAGKEKLKAIITSEKINLMETQFKPDGSFFYSSSSSSAARDISIIKTNVDKISDRDWAETSFEFTVENK